MYNKNNYLDALKSTILSVTKELQDREELKHAIEQADTIEKIVRILQSAEPYTQKEFEIIKEAIKVAIRNNENLGPITKNIFENIVSSDASPSTMYKQIVLYGATHDTTI